ncbi:uncharacterized protein LOC124410151 [Diprion similis]|uniref:uncharacterized protein LOC124410151 n=1 Tax=Diprion similis TaxID=362088 RepID=UPI001EF9B11D|nr:uncharacterized protein LOC124410151 [Diprion similis]
MAFKFVTLFALVAAANAGVLAPAPLAYHAAPAYAHAVPAYGYAGAPLAKAVVAKTVDADYDAHPQYSYAYDVQDSITGDNKQQHETRDGDVVQGSYSLIESDGTRRTVDYTADPVNGFNAVVHKEPAGVAVKTVAAPVVAKYAAPVAHAPLAYAAPVAHAPLSYAAPAAHVTYAAPAVAHAAPLSYSAYGAPTAHVSYAAPAYAYHHYAKLSRKLVKLRQQIDFEITRHGDWCIAHRQRVHRQRRKNELFYNFVTPAGQAVAQKNAQGKINEIYEYTKWNECFVTSSQHSDVALMASGFHANFNCNSVNWLKNSQKNTKNNFAHTDVPLFDNRKWNEHLTRYEIRRHDVLDRIILTSDYVYFHHVLRVYNQALPTLDGIFVKEFKLQGEHAGTRLRRGDRERLQPIGEWERGYISSFGPTATPNCISNPQDVTAAMAFKFVALFALVAAANAGVLAPAPLAYHAAPAYGYAAPIAKAVVTKTVDADYDPNPQYSYSYDVQDSITGDNKQQHETRNGDVVQGSYSLIESDGTRRIVDYTADPVNGFNAVVHKEPAGVAVKTVAAPVVAKYAAPVAHAPLAYAAPVAHAPLSYAAPAAHVTYAAPAVAHAAPLSYSAYGAPTAHVSYAAPAYAYHH